jgi:cytochrome c5
MRQGLLLCALVVAAGVMSGGWAGASTRTQVDAGLQVYQSRCSRCHGAEMEGGMTAGSWAPALKRADFFQSKNATDFNTLRAYIKRTMPIGEENTLTDEESVNLAHLLRSANGIAADGFAEPAFRQLWETADQPVQRGQARRSWLWGPEGFAVHWEPYDGQPRLVQYFDKTRMEITTLVPPSQPRPDDYVTTGLLATELVSGRLQTGRSTFEERAPAAVTVAGDANDPNGPTYATFRNRRSGRRRRPERRAGQLHRVRLLRARDRPQHPARLLGLPEEQRDDLRPLVVPGRPADHRGLLGAGARRRRGEGCAGAGLPAPRADLYARQRPGLPGRDGQRRAPVPRLALQLVRPTTP